MGKRIISEEEIAAAKRFGEHIPVYKIDEKTILKTGDVVRMAEAAAMKMVREKTTIPVPEVQNAYVDVNSGHVCIVMDFIPGDRLDVVWDGYDENQRKHVIGQLRSFIEQLRNIKGSFIGSVDESPCEDPLFTDEPGGYGPYRNEREFNPGINVAISSTETGGWLNMVSDMVQWSLKDHEIVLTHGDFCPRNILVQDTKVTAVLDWEFAGFYPEYWEYMKALYKPPWNSKWIEDRIVNKIMRPYFPELAVFQLIQTVIW